MSFQRATDAVKKRFFNGGLILLYHRVTRLERDPQLLSVAPERFAEHLDVLRRKANVVPLKEVIASQESGFRSRTVAITFDDGYADNFFEARPLLERFEMPATVFVVSGFVGSEQEFWWDDLDRMLLEPGDCGWHVECDSDFEARQTRYRDLCRTVRAASNGERLKMLEQVRLAKGLPAAGRPTHRIMTREEVQQLAQGGLVEIGAHTETHPVLSALSIDDQMREIDRSKRQLEECVGKPIESFAYPFGGKKDYNRESISCARAAGFSVACSNFNGMVWPRTSRFELPRMLVRDWNGEHFERTLNDIFP
jgi:peptidoglycan/xylan/chitin deacetylase (PgdA/CDA1 family)